MSFLRELRKASRPVRVTDVRQVVPTPFSLKMERAILAKMIDYDWVHWAPNKYVLITMEGRRVLRTMEKIYR